MPNLIDAWMADRVPGLGKTFSGGTGGAGGTNPVSGIVAAGITGTIPSAPSFPVLPEAGTTIPPAGSSDRAAFFEAFKSAVGFDGQTALYGWDAGTDSPSFSLSAWVDFGVTTVAGWTPDPTIGSLYGANYVNPFNPPIISSLTLGCISGPKLQISGWFNTGETGVLSWPGDGTTNAGWVHAMVSFKANATTDHDHYQIYLNNTAALDSLILQPGLVGPYNNSFSKTVGDAQSIDPPGTVEQYIGGRNGGGESGTMTDAFKGAVTELVVYQGHFVDWSLQANRDLFQVTDITRTNFAPADIGSTGSKALGIKPTLYLTGGPSSFIINRASGKALSVLLANLSPGLFLVDDPPG